MFWRIEVGLFIVVAILCIFSVGIVLVTGKTWQTALNVYLYDGSSVYNGYKEVTINNDNYNLGEQLRLQGNYTEAIPFFDKALEELQTEYSEESLEIAQIRMRLGVTFLSLHILDDAHEQFSNAYVTYKNIFGEKHENTGLARMYWGITNEVEGDYESGLADINEAFSHISYFVTRQQASYYYSEILNENGDHIHALEWIDRYLNYIECLAEKRWGNTVYFGKANGEMLKGDIFLKMRDINNAEAYYEEALADLDKSEAAPSTEDLSFEVRKLRFRIYQRLAEVRSGQGNKEGEMEMFSKAAEYSDTIAGEDYLYYISIAAYKSGSKELPDILLNNLEKTISINGENSVYTVRHLILLSEYYLSVKDYDDAQQVCKRALDIQKNNLLEKEPVTLDIYVNLATSTLALGDNEKAIEYALRGLQIGIELYGYKAQRNKTPIIQIVAALNQETKYDKALEIIEICREVQIPESNDAILSSFDEYEKKYILKVNDDDTVSECKKKAGEMAANVNDNNFYDIIKSVLDSKTDSDK